jgi:hypothetical protein
VVTAIDLANPFESVLHSAIMSPLTQRHGSDWTQKTPANMDEQGTSVIEMSRKRIETIE